MAQRKFKQGAPPKDFQPIPEGWYIGEVSEVKVVDQSNGSTRYAFGITISHGTYSDRWAWLTIWCSDSYIDDKGKLIVPSNYKIRKLMALKDPKGHALHEVQEGQEAEFVVEEGEWFKGLQLAIYIEPQPYISQGGEQKIADRVTKFCGVHELSTDKLARGRADSRAESSSFSGGDSEPSSTSDDDDLPF